MGGSRSVFVARQAFRRRGRNLHRDGPAGLVRMLARSPPFSLTEFRVCDTGSEGTDIRIPTYHSLLLPSSLEGGIMSLSAGGVSHVAGTRERLTDLPRPPVVWMGLLG